MPSGLSEAFGGGMPWVARPSASSAFPSVGPTASSRRNCPLTTESSTPAAEKVCTSNGNSSTEDDATGTLMQQSTGVPGRGVVVCRLTNSESVNLYLFVISTFMLSFAYRNRSVFVHKIHYLAQFLIKKECYITHWSV